MFKWLKGFFNKAFQIIEAVLSSVFTSAFKLLMVKLQDIATESITKLATTDITNAEKRDLVFKDIKSYAKTKLISVNDREINLIIEIFYNNLKNKGVIK